MKSKIGKDLGTFSNLKIKNKRAISNKVEINKLFIIDIISLMEAYLHIPRYSPKYLSMRILDILKKIENTHKLAIKLYVRSKSSLIQSAKKKEIERIEKS